MLNKLVLTVLGLVIGFVSFAATGVATSLLMTEVQERAVPQHKPATVNYAEWHGAARFVTR